MPSSCFGKKGINQHVFVEIADTDSVEHMLSLKELSEKLQINLNGNTDDLQGLSFEQATLRQLEQGKNALRPPKQQPEIVKFARHFTNLFMMLLIFAGLLSNIAYAIDTSQPWNLWLGISLYAIVVFSCCLSYFQERKSSTIIKSFQKMLPQNCKVIRAGTVVQIKTEDLVCGDLVKLNSGDKIPADIRLIKCTDFKVEQASITGESEPVECSIASQSTEIFDSRCIAFNGSLCLEGEALGVVIRIGNDTMIGRIAKKTASTTAVQTTLHKEIANFVHLIGVISIVMACVFLTIGLLQGTDPMAVFVNGFIVVIVANIPQGLPTTVTSCLAIVVRRMAKQNAYVKQLESVETLGSATVIASDKTGTLTKNIMSVEHIWIDKQIEATSALLLTKDDTMNSPTFKCLYRIASLCNRANFSDNQTTDQDRTSTDQKKIIGDASETALLRFCDTMRNASAFRNKYQKIFEVPFNSKNKWALTIVQRKRRNSQILLMKGAPEVVLNKCSSYMKTGQEYPLDDAFLEEFRHTYGAFGRKGERVIGLAQLHLTDTNIPHYSIKEQNFPQEGLCFVGLIAMMDPPKEGVKEAVQKCKTAGIKVIMVTGDHPYTAEAIAREVGIMGNFETREEVAKRLEVSNLEIEEAFVEAAVYTGQEMETFTEQDWSIALSKKELVFARTTPHHKLMLVENLQRLNEIVAVTGDGVNDSIALKRADIGVAMGSGSDVAKEASDIVLLDDNFASIVAGIQEGRVLFDNLKKTIAYTLAHLVPEVLPTLVYLGLGFPLGMNAVLVLLVDCGTELAPAVSLAYEKMEDNIMNRPPRDARKDRLVSFKLLAYAYLQAGMIEAAFCFISYFAVFRYYGITPSQLLFTMSKNWQPGAPDFTAADGRIYSDTEQVQILREVNGAWFINLVLAQLGHIWLCKTRTQTIFQRSSFRSRKIFFAVVIELAMMLLVIYAPYTHLIFECDDVHFIFWLPSFGGILLLFLYNETRKYLGKKYPEGIFAKYINW